LLCDKPGDGPLRFKAADTCYGLALMLAVTGQRKQAVALHGRARDYYHGLLDDQPNDLGALAGLSNIHGALGALHRGEGGRAESYEATRKALAIRERLVQARPNDRQLRGGLALYHNNLGVIQSSLGRHDEALASYEKARAIREQLVRADPRGRGPRM